jgi:N-acetyl sugar amidotransferase
MDESAPALDLDASGLCRYCRQYDAIVAHGEFSGARREENRRALLASVRAAGKGRRYDCVVGLSGGADSSYAAYLARKEGLRPVAVHVDNGWDTELAVMNIENLVKKLDLDLFTWVIDWDEFRDLQVAFLRAGVVDLEMTSDHAIIAGMYATARRFGVRYILSGDNFTTEATLPPGWNHRKTDLRNLRAIHDRFTRTPLRTFPQLSTLGMLFHQRVLGITYVPFLSYFPYVKKEAIATLSRELGWREYGGKHHESIITRFYQGYILPTKFGIDKRRLHLSRLICSGQLTRAEALHELTQPHYSPRLQEEDLAYVTKKLGLSEDEFRAMMREPPVPHSAFPSDEAVLQAGITAKQRLRSLAALLPGRR